MAARTLGRDPRHHGAVLAWDQLAAAVDLQVVAVRLDLSGDPEPTACRARGRPRRGADDVPALEPRCRAPDLATSVARRADRVHPDGVADGEVRTDDAHTCRRADTSRSLRESRLQSLSVSIP